MNVSVIFLFLLSLNAYALKFSGSYQGIEWDALFTEQKCSNKLGLEDIFCLPLDRAESARLSGIEAKLLEWARKPQTKELYLSYYSFSNSTIVEGLCEEVKKRDLNINFYIDSSYTQKPAIVKLKKCSPNQVKIHGRGVGPFGTPGAHLMHMKIYMALPATVESLLDDIKKGKNLAGKAYFNSSSANLSSYGTGLHFENWLFFKTDLDHPLAKKNFCVFSSLAKENDRKTFAKSYGRCLRKHASEEVEGIKFYAVPSYKIEKPFTGFKKVVASAKKTLRIAIHRLTSGKIYSLFVDAKKKGVETSIIFDDDTLRSGVKNGGPVLSVAFHDVKAFRALKQAGVNIELMETSALPKPQLFHNKFIVADDHSLFQGAGNFTGTALNISGSGNYEQFYVITVPEIVQAYKEAWDYLAKKATDLKDHEVVNNPTLPYREIGRKEDKDKKEER